MIKANDPSRRSWVEVPSGSDFPIQNIPFGVFRTQSNPSPRLCTAIGESVVDLAVLNYMDLLDDLEIDHEVFNNRYLNDLMALGKAKVRELRDHLADILDANNEEAKQLGWHFLHPMEKVELLMPVQVGDYTDFYSSLEHATNIGKMLRPDNPLLPNWKHIPVGYHGRASSIVASGTPFVRPQGQMLPPGAEQPIFGPTKLLDFELEMAFVVGKANPMGKPIRIENAENHIFGLMLFNDWSARDIQGWEYQPLGPFLAKNFASTVSPWVVTLDALEPFRVAGPAQDPKPFPYLQFEGEKSFDINLEVEIESESGTKAIVSRSNFKYMYWNMAQQLAHHTVNGCNMNIGDLCGSGTISGPTPDSYGSMMELTWRGSQPIKLSDGSERKFINDGDTVTLRGWCERNGIRIGFGEAAGKVLPALID
jgi:fumarylacetoacetase